jgi:hypothetical protein
MTTNDLRTAIRFLERVYVGKADEELLLKTIDRLKNEIKRREKKQ